MDIKRGGSTKYMKDLAEENRNKILDFIIEKPGINVTELANKSGLTTRTVTKITKYFKVNNLIYSRKNGTAVQYFPLEAGSEPTNEDVTYSVDYLYNRKHQYSEATANRVIEIIRNNPGISTPELLEETKLDRKTVSLIVIDYVAKGILKSDRSRKPDTHRNVKCYWLAASETEEPVTTEPEKEEKEVERYPEHKNDEGYNDLTAAPTIRKLDDIFGTFAPGSVWTLSTAYGADAEYLVLRSYKGWVTGMMLQDDLQQYSPVYCVPVSMVDRKYVDCRRILTKPSKYFIEKKCDIPNFERVKSKICYLLGIEPEVVEKIVEKPVEVTKEVEVVKEVPVEVIKEVEKPVEVIKEVPVEVFKEVVKEVEVEKTVDAVDTALLRQKADIYERIAWQFLNSIASVAEEVGR